MTITPSAPSNQLPDPDPGTPSRGPAALGRKLVDGARVLMGSLRRLWIPGAHRLGEARWSLGAWWRSRTVRFRRVVRTVGLLLVVAVVSLTVGMTTARASSPVGPHEATWEVTVNSEITLDMGPLGLISMDSPIAPVGVDVVLGEIPSQLGVRTLDTADTTAVSTALTSDLSSYVGLVSRPELTIEAGVRALVQDGLRRAGLIASVLLLLVAAGRLASDGHLRDAVRRAALHPLASTLVVACALAGTGAVLVPAVRSGHMGGTRLQVLADTPLASARFSGRIADVVQAYGTVVTDFLDANDTFYTEAGANLSAAWAASQDVGGIVDVTGSDGGAVVVAPDGELVRTLVARSEGLGAVVEPSDDAQGTTSVMTTDLHCNLDVIAFAGHLDALADADLHMDAGDLTMTGSDPEQVCVDALNSAVPSGTAKVATTGNHDSSSTAARLRSLGWTVTDGTIQSVGGLRVLGDVDPQRTTATGTVRAGDETAAQLGARLAEVSCSGPRAPDVVLIHQPGTFGELAENGCAPLLVAGHVHSEKGMTVVTGTHGEVAELISGAAKGSTSLGKVTENAYLHVLRFAADGSLTAWRVVVLHSDASVTVGRWLPLPASSGEAATPDSQDGDATTGPTDGASQPASDAAAETAPEATSGAGSEASAGTTGEGDAGA